MAVNQVNDLDCFDDLNDMSLMEVQLREDAITRFWETSRKQKAWLFQNSCFKWVKNGDENTKLFHSIIKWGRRVNVVKGMHIQGVWVRELVIVKKEIK